MAKVIKETPILTGRDAVNFYKQMERRDKRKIKTTIPVLVEENVFYGSRITYLRFINNITQTELAKKCQCSKQAISFYESGERMPKEPIILMLCNVFGVSREVFFRYKFSIEVLGNRFIIKPDAI